MQATETILAVLTTCLPEIQRILGTDRWPAFVDRLRGHAASFQNLASEAELTRAVNELLALFYENHEIKNLLTKSLTRPRTDERGSPLGRKPPPECIDIQSVAVGFVMLCTKPELISSTGVHNRSSEPDERVAPSSPADQRSAGMGRAQPE